MDKIVEFRGEYWYLSNFFNTPVYFEGLWYGNNESAFQSAKVENIEDRKPFCRMTGAEAKKAGRKVQLRKDWEEIKLDKMYEICYSKFDSNSDLKTLLLETDPMTIEEGNAWGDRFWGVCDGTGQNNLGKILMRIREELGE